MIGATVIAAASSDAKLEVAKKLGATHLINYSSADVNISVKKITKGQGVDVVYELVGGEIFNQVAISSFFTVLQQLIPMLSALVA